MRPVAPVAPVAAATAAPVAAAAAAGTSGPGERAWGAGGGGAEAPARCEGVSMAREGRLLGWRLGRRGGCGGPPRTPGEPLPCRYFRPLGQCLLLGSATRAPAAAASILPGRRAGCGPGG